MQRLLLLMCALLCAASMSGCAGFETMADAHLSAALTAAQTAEDINIQIWRTNACATPLSATLRNPSIIPALKSLCLTKSASDSVSDLLDSTTSAAAPTAVGSISATTTK